VVEFDAVQAGVAQAAADLLVVPCYAGPEPGPGAGQAAELLGIDLAAVLGRHGFTGEIGDSFATLTLGRLPAETVLFVGLGARAGAGPAAIRRASMLAARQIARAGRVATTLPAGAIAAGHAGSGPDAGPDAGADAAPHAGGGPDAGPDAGPVLAAASAAFAEGLLLGGYQFSRYLRDPVLGLQRPALERVQILVGSGDQARAAAGLRRGQALASLTNWVRDLVNASPSDATPADLAGEAQRLAADCGLGCTVLGAAELAAGGFGGILGVGQGSKNPPALVELSYRGGGDSPVIGLTGKGITFDSGGLNLKRTAEIEYMKSDMAGAATVMGVLRGVAESGLPVNIDAVLPFAENMPGGSAQRPGDVLVHRGGKTSEIRDTDAEGRLLLADTLAYLAERKPSVLVDVATLTDAAGLGEALWAVLGTAESHVAGLIAAGREAGDPGWHLPLPVSYRRYLASAAADVRNTPSEVADTTVMAATYLREFTGSVPWLHIDNGSTAYLERPGDGWPEGATGSPVRALLRWIERLAGSPG
jgi:leucyl aminopeptidase